ncbi:MAG: aminotransferase class V-fold PLP-dependent enzyme [Herbinix sp.]|nr:aminotransferase class V-fold PLP-dependent enzyme [Herbinix sp.]
MRGEPSYKDLRKLIIGADQKIPLPNGKYVTAINFDNAATTPVLYSVLKEINHFALWYSSVHRGGGYKSKVSSDIYEQGRAAVQSFVNSDKERDIVIFTKNTTESINVLSFVLSQQKGQQKVVLSTWMEHAANDLPWRNKFKVDYVEIDRFGRLSIEDLEDKLVKYRGSVKLVSVTGASNVTGYMNPIHKIAALAHKYGAKILVDGAQLVPHTSIDMKQFDMVEHIDYLVFSAHKMYAPFGAGVLIGPKNDFNEGNPFIQGGGAISLVTHERVEWDDPAGKDEAGTPNAMGVVALTAAIKTLRAVGMDNIYKREKALYDYTISRMAKIPGIKFYSDPFREDTIGVIPFNLEGVHHNLIPSILSDEAGISVRNGFFCTHPYCERLLGLSEHDMKHYFEDDEVVFPGMVRVSFGFYNSYREIDKFLNILRMIADNKEYYINKYSNDLSSYKTSNEARLCPNFPTRGC